MGAIEYKTKDDELLEGVLLGGIFIPEGCKGFSGVPRGSQGFQGVPRGSQTIRNVCLRPRQYGNEGVETLPTSCWVSQGCGGKAELRVLNSVQHFQRRKVGRGTCAVQLYGASGKLVSEGRANGDGGALG